MLLSVRALPGSQVLGFSPANQVWQCTPGIQTQGWDKQKTQELKVIEFKASLGKGGRKRKAVKGVERGWSKPGTRDSRNTPPPSPSPFLTNAGTTPATAVIQMFTTLLSPSVG